MIYRFLTLLCLSSLLSACYLQGGTCSGPLCVAVSTEGCSLGGCNSPVNSERNEQQLRCPDADTTETLARNTINSARQNPSLSRCLNAGTVAIARLVWNETLFAAADRQARDMASNNFVDGTGSDGVSISQRLQDFSEVTQFVAGGFFDAKSLIDEWLSDSPDCLQLLSALKTDFALACRYDAGSDFSTYWSLVLARRQ